MDNKTDTNLIGCIEPGTEVEVPHRIVRVCDLEGYISDGKSWPGVPKWTGDFTPPTEPYRGI